MCVLVCATTSLTLSFLSREENKVILHGGAVIGKCQFQPELIEVAHAGNRWVRHVGRVSKLIKSTKSGSSNFDGCGDNKNKWNPFFFKEKISDKL